MLSACDTVTAKYSVVLSARGTVTARELRERERERERERDLLGTIC